MYGLEFGKVGGGPTSPMDTVLLFAMFACREMEAAIRLVGHLHIKKVKDVEWWRSTFRLPRPMLREKV